MRAVRLSVVEVTERLALAGCIAAGDEAAELLAVAHDDVTLEVLLRRREQGEPLAWITGTARFCGREVQIDPGVYVPRTQSEELARRAATILVDRGDAACAADLCTGSGAIAAHLIATALAATVIGVDLDAAAAACARRNGVPAVVGDLGRPLARRSFDVVTAVAPYVPTGELRVLPADVVRYEPRTALDGGDDGLELVRRVIRTAAELLRPGGCLLTEVGGEQDRLLVSTLDDCGFGPIGTWRDDDGDLRGIAAQLAASAAHEPRGCGN